MTGMFTEDQLVGLFNAIFRNIQESDMEYGSGLDEDSMFEIVMRHVDESLRMRNRPASSYLYGPGRSPGASGHRLVCGSRRGGSARRRVYSRRRW